MSAAAHIFQGAWINWDQNRVLGATITLSSPRATILIAFTAIFVKVAGDRFWAILRFVLHQRCTNENQPDGLRAQQRVILKNTVSDVGTVWEFLQLVYYWRSRADGFLRRCLPIALLASLNFAVWTASGIFSSQVSRAAGGNEVLIRSPSCGVNLPSEKGIRANQAGQVREQNRTRIADDYMKTCYNVSGPSGSERCQRYTKQQIPWKSNESVECPFAKEVCEKGVKAYEMDTGMVDSHVVLGINAKTQDRIQYRRRTTCAILNTEDYSKTVFNERIGLTFSSYYYGYMPGVSSTNETFRAVGETTFAGAGYDIAYGSPLPIAFLQGPELRSAVLGPVEEGSLFPSPNFGATTAISPFSGSSQTLYAIACPSTTPSSLPMSLSTGPQSRPTPTAQTSWPA